MVRCLPLCLASRFRRMTCLAMTASTLCAGTAAAQDARVVRTSVAVFDARPLEASARGGELQGTVRDQDGSGITGVSVTASGVTTAAVLTDMRGRFALRLPAGAYVVRAARSGYVSSSRQVVSVQSDARLERTITLARAADVVAAAQAADDDGDAPGHSEIAWRLRHLKRTVLRDVVATAVPDGARPDTFSVAMSPMAAAARAVAAIDFTGQVGLLATSAIGDAMMNTPDGMSAGVANVIIGAPVGTSGDWSVRGAVAASGLPSWTLLGEYRGRSDRAHAVRIGMSYSSQGFSNGRPTTLAAAVPESRSAGSVRFSDDWSIHRRLAVDYDVSVDRYDYLAPSAVMSPRIGARVLVWNNVFVVASSARRTIAPGADQFLPSAAAGPWLPPTRTFSALAPGKGLNAELVRNDRAGIEYRPGAAGGDAAGPSIGFDWFSQSVTNQLATLFGIDAASETGHYYLSTVGDVDVAGWRVRAGGRLVEHVTAEIAFATAEARWTGTRAASLLRRTAPELARRGVEQVSNLTTTLDLDVPRTSTQVLVDYRFTLTDQTAETRRFAPLGGGRFNLEIRQRLPFQPLDAGVLNLLFTLRTLLHDDVNGSMYDELLTLRPPTRLTSGVQVRF